MFISFILTSYNVAPFLPRCLQSLAAVARAGDVPYTMAKYGMSMCVLGMAEESRDRGVAFNALWPRTTIATAAIENLLGGEAIMRPEWTRAVGGPAAVEASARPNTRLNRVATSAEPTVTP